ncbi:hypothetical protein T12_11275 [Trichinella patagoniensis]|uniref:Uncharacterized protein n=1 Tax=Trichinella patagoniensis TaxID=990121 RepID=A0A0V0YP23_9BILA|nr:hypothetical protein T12_11275 [Trichinella patagoniensis]
MYRLAEVEAAALYFVFGKLTLRTAALFIKAWKINPYVPISLPVHKQ